MASLTFFSSTALSAHASNLTSPVLHSAATEQRRCSPRIRCAAAADGGKEGAAPAQAAAEAAPAAETPLRPKKPVYSMKKGQIVRVEKEKYLNSINYLSVGHPPYYKGLDYIYEDRGEVLDIRIFETGEHALIAWVGIPTSPAWLPTDMLIKHFKRWQQRMKVWFTMVGLISLIESDPPVLDEKDPDSAKKVEEWKEKDSQRSLIMKEYDSGI
ncbi:hypothetical protein Taro_025640 [Colocasia esculenta]|uniref:NADH dehydrogenase-like complex O n=2 Tax=Magnoliopsida TaxID=3398 RepID=A0A843VNW3_COLES|nr:hypothetical protein [Colocasia esculenta]